MDESHIRTIKDSWNKASNSINTRWAIDLYRELEEGDFLESDGVFYSPVNDLNRPYPVSIFDFTLKYIKNERKFHLKTNFELWVIKNEKGDSIKSSNITLDGNDVSNLLDSLSHTLFPEIIVIDKSNNLDLIKKKSEEIRDFTLNKK